MFLCFFSTKLAQRRWIIMSHFCTHNEIAQHERGLDHSETWFVNPQSNLLQWLHQVGVPKVYISREWGMPACMFRSPSTYGTLKHQLIWNWNVTFMHVTISRQCHIEDLCGFNEVREGSTKNRIGVVWGRWCGSAGESTMNQLGKVGQGQCITF